MAVREIHKLPKYEKLLREPCAPVSKVNRKVRALVQDLMDTLATAEGVGLAAPQIGVMQRVALVMVGADDCDGAEEEVAGFLPLINPEIIEENGIERGYDGCLSIPGLQGYTNRPQTMRIRSLDMQGNLVEHLFEGFDARVAAHEIDHLNGVLYLDRLETLEDLFYLVPGEEDTVEFLPYLEVHPEYRLTPNQREGLPTQGVETIA